jgi:hypothetical protein
VGARFCDGCGRPLPRRAPGEGEAPAEPSDVATLGSPGPSPSQDRAPRDYTPKHLAEKILTSKSALEGERKQVTVLFADVKGSLDLAEQVDPEEWHRILNRFFEILSDGVHRFEGTVNQYTGDGIMALFGAPITHEDHAQRACYTALQLTEELGRYSEELKRTEGLNFAVRMGLSRPGLPAGAACSSREDLSLREHSGTCHGFLPVAGSGRVRAEGRSQAAPCLRAGGGRRDADAPGRLPGARPHAIRRTHRRNGNAGAGSFKSA